MAGLFAPYLLEPAGLAREDFGPPAAAQLWVLAPVPGTQLDSGVVAADGYDLFTGNTLAEAHHEPAEANYGARPTPCARVVVERPEDCSHAGGAAQVRGPLRRHLLQDPWIHSHIQILWFPSA